MKFKIFRTSDWVQEPTEYVEINTIEELWALHKNKGHNLIIGQSVPQEEPFIEIYDDYRE